ncbi:hypothetical protein [Planococcus lenghuensis]|uniref:Uncharacterized protein n=1 Tax=Planococcus lenghuensis TaxID=2213202 RepID=A0A1Q2L346_9BACL|nr:hypothetical protein [Planococcus lenghuensis]AQQ54836.1 hypothetical protein B0X71_18170 [Planococcus lenghuensis]
MGEFQTLKLLAKLRWLFSRLGIDYRAMEIILRMKFTMDGRRTPSVFNDARREKKGNQFLKSLWIYALYSLILIPVISTDISYMYNMSIAFALLLFVLTTAMIADFSSVLLDVRDRNILQTKPVSQRTVSAAKIVHILVYVSFITGTFSAVPLIVGLVQHGIGFLLIFLVEIGLAMLLSVVATSLLYLLVLRFLDGERLKDIINYVQILLSVAVVVGYQVLARSFEFTDMNAVYEFSWWHVLLPPLWYGAPFELLLAGNTAGYVLLFSVLSVMVPLVAAGIYLKGMPSFERNLEKLMSSTAERKPKKNRLNRTWAFLLCRTEEERVFFRFGALLMKREREFKLKVYPALGMALVFPFLFLWNDPGASGFAADRTGNGYLTVYFSNFIIPNALLMLKFSEGYKGSWLFRAAPVRHEGAAYSGALKAFIVLLYLPVFLLLSAVFIWLFSPEIIPGLIAVFLSAVLQVLLTHHFIRDETYPFSRSFEFAHEANGAKMFGLGLITGGFALVHLVFVMIPFGNYLYAGVLAVAVFIGWRGMFPVAEKRKHPAKQAEAG